MTLVTEKVPVTAGVPVMAGGSMRSRVLVPAGDPVMVVVTSVILFLNGMF